MRTPKESLLHVFVSVYQKKANFKTIPNHSLQISHPFLGESPRAAQVIVLLVLLVSWLDLPQKGSGPYQVVEVFSGVGRIAGLAKTYGYNSAAIDIEIGEEYAKQRGGIRSPMDINSNAGLMFHGHITSFLFGHLDVYFVVYDCYIRGILELSCWGSHILIALDLNDRSKLFNLMLRFN